ncbi:MAG: TonB-dependent receptor, partial [Sphingomonas sp.]
RSVRAPNVSETSFPAVPNFANGFIDPCNINAIANGTAARVTNCQSQLSAGQLSNLQLGGYSLGVISGSNPNLLAETADSYTLGTILQPRFIPGFTLSIDYYDITVNNVIVSLAAQTIVNACYDTPNLQSPLCNGFRRNLGTTNGANGELPGQILTNTVIQGPQNFARRVRKGIDVEAAYRHTFGQDVALSSRVNYTHGLQNSNYENPTIPDTENVILSELGDPVDEFKFNADLTVNRITFGYGMHFYGPMLTSTFENFYPNNAGVTGQTGLPLNADAIEIRKYPTVIYQNVRMNFRIGDKLQGRNELDFYVGIDNLTDRQPPFGTTATGSGSAIYSVRGRNFYAGFKARF